MGETLTARSVRHLKLGEKLLHLNVITSEQLKIALEIQKSTGKLLGEILIDLGFVDQGTLSSLLSQDIGLNYLTTLEEIIPDPHALSLIPQEVAKKYKLVPLSIDDNSVTVVMSDPYDIMAVDTVKQLSGKVVNTIVAAEEEILKAIDSWYTEIEEFDHLVKKSIEAISQDLLVEEAPLIKLVNIIIINGIKKRATDIHIGPEKNSVIIRYRIDGVLHVWNLLPKELARAVVSRLKVMANLDISETRIPQDGRIGFKFAGKNIDLRLSTYPTAEGENIVMRILDKSKLISSIDALGYSNEQTNLYKDLIKNKYGLVLVTGPTGSGKTTSLYAALLEINSTRINIMTVEDPIEYELPFIRQSQINVKSGFTYAKALRAILRQDPDVIMVGEIRDEETLEIALHASLTGHLVLSTLHTNTALAAISRLNYMGSNSYILASALKGVVAQRLIRRICPYCKEQYLPTDEEKELIMDVLGIDITDKFLYKGKGCDKCLNTGYLGRIAISEIFKVTKDIFNGIVRQKDESQLFEILKKEGFTTLLEDGLKKALDGITTIEEVRRVI